MHTHTCPHAIICILFSVRTSSVGLLKEHDKHHGSHTGYKRKHFLDRLPQPRVLKQLWDHTDGGDIDEPTRCEGQNPTRVWRSCCFTHQANACPCHCANGRRKLQFDRLPRCATRLDQNGKVANLMRHFMQQDCHKRHPWCCLRVQEDGPQCQSIGKVVGEIRSQIEVPCDANVTLFWLNRHIAFTLLGALLRFRLVVRLCVGSSGRRSATVRVPAMRVAMPIAPLEVPYHLLHNHKRQDTPKCPEPHHHLFAMVVSAIATTPVIVIMTVPMCVVVTAIATSVVVWVESVWDEVQEGVAEETARGKAKQDVEKRFAGLCICQWDKGEHHNRCAADDECCRQSFAPDSRFWIGKHLLQQCVHFTFQ
eukprot:m.11313 g.11313  ORF g.11313 m.11313 type:complete len:365 (+) comp2836_c0_seq2:1194-2288(+)